MLSRRGTIALVVSMLSAPSLALAGGSNAEHQLVVNSLTNYAEVAPSVPWKHSIPTYQSMDPYYDFFEIMYNCTTDECAHDWSRRYKDSAVTVNAMASTSNGTWFSTRGWSASDLVVFYGHNTQVLPQWEDEIDVWSWSSGLGQWVLVNVPDWRIWGTTARPYEYHRLPLTDASLTNAFAIFYGYNPFTSILVGRDFAPSATWYTENVWNQAVADERSNKLGDKTEWLIANGCNAVTVADRSANSIALGVNAWRRSWSAMHIVMGHYTGTDTGRLPNLNQFAQALKGVNGQPGDLIWDAYRDAHSYTHTPYENDRGYGQPAAIERAPWSCCNYVYPFGWLCPPAGCSEDYLNQDRWQPNEMADLTGTLNSYYYATEWREAIYP